MTWQSPDDAGSPLLGYTLTIVENDGVAYSVETTNCDMSSSLETSCVIPVATLRSAPFSLDWGTSVFAKVVATNAYGDSEASDAGNGAVIITKPDPPENLGETISERTVNTLTLSWSPPTFSGGAVVLDYKIHISTQGSAFSVLADDVTGTSYVVSNTAPGTIYQFKIECRTAYSYSDVTDPIVLLFSFNPEPPQTVTTSNSNHLVVVSWSDPETNGA